MAFATSYFYFEVCMVSFLLLLAVALQQHLETNMLAVNYFLVLFLNRKL